MAKERKKRKQHKHETSQPGVVNFEEGIITGGIGWNSIVYHPPEVDTFFILYFSQEMEGPCIYEYTKGRIKKPVKVLTYPQKKARNYYLEGDKILTFKWNENQFKDFCSKYRPELVASNYEIGWKDLLVSFLNENESKTYEGCYIIDKIIPNKDGTGKVKMHAVILFEDNLLKIDDYGYPFTWTHSQLDNDIRNNFSYASIISSIAKIVVEISLIPFTSVGKASTTAVKKLATKVIFRQARRPLTKKFRIWILKVVIDKTTIIIKNIGRATKNVTPALVEFFSTLVKELITKNPIEAKKKLSNETELKSHLEGAILKACVAFIAKMIDDQLKPIMGCSIASNQAVDKVINEIAAEIATKYYKFLAIQIHMIIQETIQQHDKNPNEDISAIFQKNLLDNSVIEFKSLLISDIPSLLTK